MQEEIKIIRLNDGEDIISSYHVDESDEGLIVNNPMTLFFKRLGSTRSVVMMAPWLPIELICNTSTRINNSQILTIMEPRKSLIEYYLNAVNNITENIRMNEDSIDESLLDNNHQEDDDLDEEDSIEEDVEIHKLLEGTSKVTLH
jgi:hypothetical protein